jgi:hypothetical protein
MGQAKANLSRIIRQQDPICIYCSVSTSDDADHAPPKNLFTLKDRPKGLEFGICKECHEPTRQIDQIAASYGRMMPPPTNDIERAEIRKYAQATVNNYPEVAAIFGGPSRVTNQGMHVIELTDDNGTRLHNAMNAFAGRMGMALYRETVGRPVAQGMYIHAHYFTSWDIATDTIPPEVFVPFKNPRTLRQGVKEKSSEFLYDNYYDDEIDYFACFAMVRESFAVWVVISRDVVAMPQQARNGAVYRPGFLRGLDWRKVA